MLQTNILQIQITKPSNTELFQQWITRHTPTKEIESDLEYEEEEEDLKELVMKYFMQLPISIMNASNTSTDMLYCFVPKKYVKEIYKISYLLQYGKSIGRTLKRTRKYRPLNTSDTNMPTTKDNDIWSNWNTEEIFNIQNQQLKINTSLPPALTIATTPQNIRPETPKEIKEEPVAIDLYFLSKLMNKLSDEELDESLEWDANAYFHNEKETFSHQSDDGSSPESLKSIKNEKNENKTMSSRNNIVEREEAYREGGKYHYKPTEEEEVNDSNGQSFVLMSESNRQFEHHVTEATEEEQVDFEEVLAVEEMSDTTLTTDTTTTTSSSFKSSQSFILDPYLNSLPHCLLDIDHTKDLANHFTNILKILFNPESTTVQFFQLLNPLKKKYGKYAIKKKSGSLRTLHSSSSAMSLISTGTNTLPQNTFGWIDGLVYGLSTPQIIMKTGKGDIKVPLIMYKKYFEGNFVFFQKQLKMYSGKRSIPYFFFNEQTGDDFEDMELKFYKNGFGRLYKVPISAMTLATITNSSSSSSSGLIPVEVFRECFNHLLPLANADYIDPILIILKCEEKEMNQMIDWWTSLLKQLTSTLLQESSSKRKRKNAVQPNQQLIEQIPFLFHLHYLNDGPFQKSKLGITKGSLDCFHLYQNISRLEKSLSKPETFQIFHNPETPFNNEWKYKRYLPIVIMPSYRGFQHSNEGLILDLPNKKRIYTSEMIHLDLFIWIQIVYFGSTWKVMILDDQCLFIDFDLFDLDLGNDLLINYISDCLKEYTLLRGLKRQYRIILSVYHSPNDLTELENVILKRIESMVEILTWTIITVRKEEELTFDYLVDGKTEDGIFINAKHVPIFPTFGLLDAFYKPQNINTELIYQISLMKHEFLLNVLNDGQFRHWHENSVESQESVMKDIVGLFHSFYQFNDGFQQMFL